jgi:phosphoribosylanthranilate isomerase
MTGTDIARIQVAGVHDAHEARTLARCGVEWVGLPLRLPVHREDVTDEQAAAIVRECAGSGLVFVLITYLERAGEIAALAVRLGIRHVQLHGPIEVAELTALRAALPGVVVIKSLVVCPGVPAEGVLREMTRLAPHVDAFITDTYDPATGASGATGLTHDWAISREVVRESPRPVILAGGLTPANVREAILAVRPAGVDTHTGVENADGRKDGQRVRAFVTVARAAFAAADAGG